MDASSVLHRDQYEDPEWHAAIQLVGLCVPVADSAPDAAAAIQLVGFSVPVADSPNPDAAAAAPEVSTKNDAADVSGKEKEFKKPDTVLPCARCNSMRTKFCYFNNYKANQPRHYCKDCKRYWTDGVTLRDVPVGSARRRNRNRPSDARNGGDVAGTSRRRSRVLKPLAIPGPAAEESGAATTTTSGSEMVLGKPLCPAHAKSSTDLVGSGDNKEEKSCLPSSSAVASGKHPREEEEEEEAEKTFWVPTALRVTDPEEAARSTIWASLGIKPDERILLQSKDGNGKAPEPPAARSISCSLAFQKRA